MTSLVTMLLSITIVGGCGDADGSPGDAQPTASPSASLSASPAVTAEELAAADIMLITGETEVDLELGGYGLTQEAISSPGPTIEAEVGEPLTLALKNVHGYIDGEDIDHDFAVVSERDETSEPLWDSRIDNLDPGEAGIVTFTPQEPGRYFYICTLVGHMSSHGMWGRFTVG